MRKEETSSGISPEPLTLAEEILEEVVEIMSNKPRIEGDAKTVRDCLFTIYFYFIVCVCACGWGWGGGAGGRREVEWDGLSKMRGRKEFLMQSQHYPGVGRQVFFWGGRGLLICFFFFLLIY